MQNRLYHCFPVRILSQFDLRNLSGLSGLLSLPGLLVCCGIFGLFGLLGSFDTASSSVFTEFEVDPHTEGTASLQAEYINDDPFIDLVGAVIEEDQIVWWESDGQDPPDWTKHIIAFDFDGARSIYIDDIDSDGDQDVVAAAYEGAEVAWWSNEGGDPVNWHYHSVVTGYYAPHEVSVFDLNRDGHKDILVISSYHNNVVWWRNDGAEIPGFTSQTIGTNCNNGKAVRAGDIDGDLIPDVVTASIYGHNIVWWHNSGTNPIVWTRKQIDSSFEGGHYVHLIDMDNDSDLDIVGAAYLDHEIAWWENENHEAPWPKHLVASGVINACIAQAALIDDDDILDVVGTSQGAGEVSWWQGSEGLSDWTEKEVDNNFNRVWPLYICDIDGDNDNDIVAASGHNGNNKVRWYRNDTAQAIGDDLPLPVNKSHLPQLTLPQNPLFRQGQLRYSIPEAATVDLVVYDLTGHRVSQLDGGYKQSGSHQIDFDSSKLSTGVYFLKLVAGTSSAIEKLVVLR